jgi:YHS domain-containing protein
MVASFHTQARWRLWCLSIIAVAFWQPARSAPPVLVDANAAAAKEKLETLNGVIGQWRGTGQLRRGSTQGAWRQTSEFVWDFSQPAPAVRYLVTEGKYVREGRITWDATAQQYLMHLTAPDGTQQEYAGGWKEGRLELESTPAADGLRQRLSITPLNDKRTLALHEKTAPGGQTYFRVAEVGYTREGTHLAVAGASGRECIVTGGTGTMEVSYKGETYYVCCSGCRQAFQDDPEGTIAAFKERVKKRQLEGK